MWLGYDKDREQSSVCSSNINLFITVLICQPFSLAVGRTTVKIKDLHPWEWCLFLIMRVQFGWLSCLYRVLVKCSSIPVFPVPKNKGNILLKEWIILGCMAICIIIQAVLKYLERQIGEGWEPWFFVLLFDLGFFGFCSDLFWGFLWCFCCFLVGVFFVYTKT